LLFKFLTEKVFSESEDSIVYYYWRQIPSLFKQPEWFSRLNMWWKEQVEWARGEQQPTLQKQEADISQVDKYRNEVIITSCNLVKFLNELHGNLS